MILKEHVRDGYRPLTEQEIIGKGIASKEITTPMSEKSLDMRIIFLIKESALATRTLKTNAEPLEQKSVFQEFYPQKEHNTLTETQKLLESNGGELGATTTTIPQAYGVSWGAEHYTTEPYELEKYDSCQEVEEKPLIEQSSVKILQEAHREAKRRNMFGMIPLQDTNGNGLIDKNPHEHTARNFGKLVNFSLSVILYDITSV